jgi:hypothetical protein
LAIPTLRNQVISELPGRRCGCLLNEAKSSARVAAFNLANHNIKVPFLLFRPTSYMRTIQENSDWGGCRVSIRFSLTFFVEAEFVGSALQSISNCRVQLGRTWQEHFDQSSGFSKRVPRSQFSLQAPKFWRRTIRKKTSKW